MKYRTSTPPWYARLVRTVRLFPADLMAVVVVLVVANAALLFGEFSTPIRTAVAVPLLLFLPGYALVAAAFPAAEIDRGVELTAVERAALGFGLSVAILPMFVLLLDAAAASITLGPILDVVSIATIAAVAVAAIRRFRVPEERRFQVAAGGWVESTRAGLADVAPTDAALNVALGLSIVLATAVVGYGLLVPTDAETYTGTSLLTEGEDGPVADDYPESIAPDESATMTLELRNHEGVETEYEVVVEAQRVETDGGQATVVERSELTRTTETVAAGETWHWRHAVSPDVEGETVRVQYFVYRDDAPADPDPDTAYRTVHFWTSVPG